MDGNTPKLSEVILGQPSPADALNVVAAFCDAVDARLVSLELQSKVPDGWQAWGQEPIPVESASDEWTPDPAVEAELGALEDALQGNGDAEESKIIRAKIQLAKDRLQPPVELHDNSGQATETFYDGDGSALVTLPPPTPEQIDLRAQMVESLGLRDQYGEDLGTQYEDSFVKGGPLLLYFADRDYVNSLPDGIKHQLVQDVELSSPREAHEMGRDILKVGTDDANDLDAVKERIFGDVESGAIHNAP